MFVWKMVVIFLEGLKSFESSSYFIEIFQLL